MESKVLLYDEDDVKIGETFTRRARQLVKQQRAVWKNDEHTAVRFLQDADGWDDADEADGKESAAETDEAWLVALAEKRIEERKWFILHTVLAGPVWFALFVMFLAISTRFEISFFFTGVCVTAYTIHAYQYISARRIKSASKEERKAKALAAEIALLKAELK